jgi:L,D-transpeptidase YcbB
MNMKKILPLILLITGIIAGCSQKKASESKKDKKISKRNYSITKSNAYNDLFLDSLAVVDYISKNALPDSVSRRIISFYNTRNYEFAWFSSDGLAEQAMGFSSLLNFSGDTSARQKKLQKRMDDLMSADDLKLKETDKSIINTELVLTESLIDYTLSNFEKGFVKRKEMERFIPFKKLDPIYLSDSLLNKKHKDNKYFSDINKPYKLLSEQLRKYVALAKANQWMVINGEAKMFKEGKALPQIVALKNNLFLTGDLPQKDSTDLFDENLKNGIRSIQARFGFKSDGKITSELLAQLNVMPIERVKQILINMNRMRWLPQEPEGHLIVVNTPAFILHMYDGGKTVFSMPVVVGKEGHNTTLFSDMLTTIVFSPYWNIPPSIVKKEIIPEMEKNNNYLASNDMEITGESNGLPEVRQKPGPKNSLGKVKFLFPNSFNIYFHDTPAKALFEKDVRAYSHGCIRLSEPEKMANYLLRNNDKWTPEKINEAMNSGNEQYVKLKNPVPVFITYYTAWVDDNGILHFRDDIYGHDKEVASKMFL